MEIIDSHTHWGPSTTLGITVTTKELLGQAEKSGVSRIIIFPFPSEALVDEGINRELLRESERIAQFIPYYYIPDNLRTIPRDRGFYGGKWHWTRGIQDAASNYEVLNDPGLERFIKESEEIDLPIIVEEELAFTKTLIDRTKTLKVIIPHMGLLGGNPLDFLRAFRHKDNVCFDTALASTGTITRFIEGVGPERILFGSDVPFGTMKGELDKILSLRISEEDRALILYGNIKRLTGLE